MKQKGGGGVFECAKASTRKGGGGVNPLGTGMTVHVLYTK